MDNPEKFLKYLYCGLGSVFIFGFFILVLSFLSTMYESEVYNLDFCLAGDCLMHASIIYKYPIKLFFGLVSLAVSIATFLGITAAVYTYINNVSSNALSNHISHLQVFQEYLVIEISKHDRLNVSSVDIYGWYNSIFLDSRKGSIEVSDQYKKSVVEINSKILESNGEVQTATSDSFKYKKHQQRMTGALKEFGIEMGLHPRNDYFEIEGQVLLLIKSINKAFCPSSGVILFNERNYI